MKITGTNLPGEPGVAESTGSEIKDAIIRQLIKEVTSSYQAVQWEFHVDKGHCHCCNEFTTIELKLHEDCYIGNGWSFFNLPDLEDLVGKITEPCYTNSTLTEFGLTGGPKHRFGYRYEIGIHKFL